MESLAWWGNCTAGESKNKVSNKQKVNVSLSFLPFLYNPKNWHHMRDWLSDRENWKYEWVEPMTRTREFGKYILVLGVLIANVDPGNKLKVEDSSYFKTNILETIIIHVTFWI